MRSGAAEYRPRLRGLSGRRAVSRPAAPLSEKAADGDNDKLASVVNMLIGMRNQARANRDFAMSDQIRDQLLELGIQLRDGKEGTTFTT